MLLAYYVPHLLSSGAVGSSLSPESQLKWAWAWQLFPLGVAALMYFLANYVFASSLRRDRIAAPKRDVPVIHVTLAAPVALSAAVWWYTLLAAPVPWAALFVPRWDPSALKGLLAVRNLVQFDHLFCFGAAGLYLLYAAWDFKHAGMLRTAWAKLLGSALAATVALGPGAALGLAWLWREDVITEKRHRDAVVALPERKSAPASNGSAKPAANQFANGHADGHANGNANGYANGHASKN